MLLLVKRTHGVKNGVDVHSQLKTPPSRHFFDIISLQNSTFVTTATGGGNVELCDVVMDQSY